MRTKISRWRTRPGRQVGLQRFGYSFEVTGNRRLEFVLGLVKRRANAAVNEAAWLIDFYVPFDAIVGKLAILPEIVGLERAVLARLEIRKVSH